MAATIAAPTKANEAEMVAAPLLPVEVLPPADDEATEPDDEVAVATQKALGVAPA